MIQNDNLKKIPSRCFWICTWRDVKQCFRDVTATMAVDGNADAQSIRFEVANHR